MSTRPAPLFTIALPTYSRLGYLKEVVQSVFDQTYKDYEICLSQDHTPKGLHPEVLRWSEELSSTHKHVSFKTNERNRGLAGNWNELVNMACGKYIIILGDDDRLLPTYLEEMARLIHSHSADVAFSSQLFIDSEGNILPELTEELNAYYGRTNLPEGLLEDPIKVVLGNSVPMSASVIRTELVKKYPFKEDLNTPEIEVFLRIALDGGSFAYSPKKIAEYRVHDQSATSSGLTIDRLLGYMHDIQVPQSHEKFKKTFFADKIIPAINMSLRRGDKQLAKILLSSSYYPAKPIYKVVQFIGLFLPDFLTSKLFS